MGYTKRQAEGTELCGAGEEIPHGSEESKAVRGIAGEIGVHAERTEANEDGFVQGGGGRMVGGGAVLSKADSGKATGDGI